MNYRQIEAFHAVMITESMTLAGKMLYISQPAVSRLIIELEDEIGFKLFERKKNKLFPSAEGRLLFEEVEKSFIGLNELSKTADSIKMLQKGHLRLISMPGVSNLLLPKIMELYWKENPDINVEIESRPREVVLDWIHSKQFDFGITNLPIDNNETLIEWSIDLNLKCVLPINHPLAKKDLLEIKDLDGQDLILFPSETYIRHEIENYLKKQGLKYRIKLETRSTADIYQFVKHGAGISFVFPFDQHLDESMPGLLFKSIHSDFRATLALLRSKQKKPSLAGQNFVKIFNKYYNS